MQDSEALSHGVDAPSSSMRVALGANAVVLLAGELGGLCTPGQKGGVGGAWGGFGGACGGIGGADGGSDGVRAGGVDGGGLEGGRLERGVSHAPSQRELTSKKRTFEFAASHARIAARMVALRCSHRRSDGIACCQIPNPPRRGNCSSGKRGISASHSCGSIAQAIPPFRPSSCEPFCPALQRASSGFSEKTSVGFDRPTAQPRMA